MATLEQAATELMNLIAAVNGMKGAPDKPPEGISQFPFAVSYPSTGILYGTPGTYRSSSTLALEVHVGRSDLPMAVDAVFPFLERIADVLFDPTNSTLNNTVMELRYDNAEGGIPWTFGELDWGDTKTIGWRFLLSVKQKGVITHE